MPEINIIARVCRPIIRQAWLPFRATRVSTGAVRAHPVLSAHAGRGQVIGVTQTGSPPAPARAHVEVRPDYPQLSQAEMAAPLLYEGRSKEDGSFIIRNLKAGRYRVTVSADGFFPRMFLTDVVEGE